MWYSVPDHQINSSPSSEEEPEAFSREISSSVPQCFNYSTRDNMLVSLVLSAHEQSPELLPFLRTGFPSPRIFDKLLHLFFTKQDRKVDPWIHSASFQTNPFNVELTAMIIVASMLNTSSDSLRHLGTNLRRLLRRIILRKVCPGVFPGQYFSRLTHLYSWRTYWRHAIISNFIKHLFLVLN